MLIASSAALCFHQHLLTLSPVVCLLPLSCVPVSPKSAALLVTLRPTIVAFCLCVQCLMERGKENRGKKSAVAVALLSATLASVWSVCVHYLISGDGGGGILFGLLISVH